MPKLMLMRLILTTLAAVFFVAVLVSILHDKNIPEPAPATHTLTTTNPQQPAEQLAATEQIIEHYQVKKGSSLFESLKKDAQIPISLIKTFIQSARQAGHNLSQIPARFRYTVTRRLNLDHQDQPINIKFHLSPIKKLLLTRDDKNQWHSSIIELPIKVEKKTFTGLVESNLWDSAQKSGMPPALIIELAEIFAWQIDFNREVQPGDRWRLVVEQQFVEGKPYGWGPILAAQYQTKDETYTGIRFPQEGASASYYDVDGQSLRRIFLKSPIKFGRITSRFRKKRFHPILKKNVPHNGVDYGAPTGTKVYAVGDGRVVKAGRHGGSGIMIKIRHNSIYETAYLHLSKIAKGVRVGKKVTQGQLIGYVGSTGLATGPHLHFAFYENGRFVDPLGRKFPAADPVKPDKLTEFKLVTEKYLEMLPSWQLARL